MTAFSAGPGPRAFAHRGWHIGDLSGAENSLAALTRALAEGYRYLETDVRLTRDGVLLAFHDAVLDRVTDRSGRVGALPWDQVRQARIAGRFPIPRFDELLELLRAHPAARLNIDAKSDSTLEPLVAALHGSGVANRVCVASFSDTRLARLQAGLGPAVATALGPRRIGRLLLTGGRGGRGRHGSAVAVQVPVRFHRLPLLTSGLLRAARRAGLEVQVWTIDDPQEMRRLLDLGVDGIMTDRPDLLRDVLVDRGQWT